MEHLRIPPTIMKHIKLNAKYQNLPLLPLLGLILDEFSPDFMTFPPQRDPRDPHLTFVRLPQLHVLASGCFFYGPTQFVYICSLISDGFIYF